MERNAKLQIYQGIIQYLLETTNYSLSNIADLTNSSIKNIRTIYQDDRIPSHFLSEVNLIKLYQIILEFQSSHAKVRRFLDHGQPHI